MLLSALSASLAAPGGDWRGEGGKASLLNSVGKSQPKEVEREKRYKGKRACVTHLAPGKKKMARGTVALRADSCASACLPVAVAGI